MAKRTTTKNTKASTAAAKKAAAQKATQASAETGQEAQTGAVSQAAPAPTPTPAATPAPATPDTTPATKPTDGAEDAASSDPEKVMAGLTADLPPTEPKAATQDGLTREERGEIGLGDALKAGAEAKEQAEGDAKPSADPETKLPVLLVTGPKKGRWRAGLHFTREPREFLQADLSEVEFIAIDGDDKLVLKMRLPDGTILDRDHF